MADPETSKLSHSGQNKYYIGVMQEKASPKRSFREIIPKQENQSWQRLDRKLYDGIPFLWHHHPEMELTFTQNCRGQRFIGDHVSAFGDGDLALVGSNLPHSWVARERLDATQPFSARVIWFDRSWLGGVGESSPELASLSTLATKAQRGMSFSPSVRQQAQPLINRLFEVSQLDGFTVLLELLRILSLDDEATPLASHEVIGSLSSGYKRIDRILHILHENYSEPLRIGDLANVAALSPSGLHRMFRRHMQTTISEYLTNLRIGEACARLTASNTPIGIIASDVGYESQANFNRHFLRRRGMSPRSYRNTFQHI